MKTHLSKPRMAAALRRRIIASALALAFAAIPTIGSATHSWGNYHWARPTTVVNTSFTLTLRYTLTGGWLGDSAGNSYIGTTSSDWNVSDYLETRPVAVTIDPKRCNPTAGMVQVCNYAYGKRGWLGIAQIWASGNHITQGAVKLNDSYFNTATYNTPAWRNLVMCQEVGHTLGLDHQDEIFNNDPLKTCMDYTSDPSLNQHPNDHDYGQLKIIYSSHSDSTSTAINATNPAAMPREMREGDFGERSQWGALVKSSKKGLKEIYRREFGGGYQLITFVTWAAGEGRGRH